VNDFITSLPVVVLYAHSRCNCRCLMCDIWKNTERREIGEREMARYIEDFERLSVRWVVFSGGEPLMHSDLFRLCAMLQRRRVRVTILSSGLLLARHAARIVEFVDDVIASLDGPEEVHDRIRRTPGAFAALARGVEAIERLRPEYPIAARCTVQRSNHCRLRETAEAARRMGMRSISFLAADVTSEAFNRPDGWTPERQSEVALEEAELPRLESELEALIREWGGSGFVMESEEKLRRIALHFRAHLGLCAPEAPRCNAPWVSAVIEADGALRPCFFHPAIGRVGEEGLAAALNSPRALAFRAGLDVAADPVCRRCVCSLQLQSTAD
jgi:MoaA/NifB/PqqE/SkfB family radical SAM enzyme